MYKLAYSWEGNPKSPFIPTVVVILVTDLADQAFITHAAPGSKTEAFARKLADSGKPLLTLNSPANTNLMEMGAEVFDPARNLMELISHGA